MCFRSKRKKELKLKKEPIVDVNQEGNKILAEKESEKDVDNTKHSSNKIYYDNDYIYEGEHLNSRKHGFGIYYRRKGDGDMYIGDYANNLYHGKGFYKWKNGNRIFGDWNMGVLNGIGVFVSNNGDKYAGEFLNDKPNGNGIYFHSNGNRYEGQFFNGEKHGSGVFYVNNGKYVGTFERNQIKECCKFYVKNKDGKYTYENNCIIKIDENGNVLT